MNILEFIQRLFFGATTSSANSSGGPTGQAAGASGAGGASTASTPSFSNLVSKGMAQTVAPNTQQYDFISIQTMPSDGRLLAQAQVAGENPDGSMTVAASATQVQTGSGQVVQVAQIVSRCQHPWCGEVEADLLRCDDCGTTRCYRHCRQVTVAGVERILCLEHLDEFLRSWDTWAAHDYARQLAAPPSTSPPKPTAVRKPAKPPRAYAPYPNPPAPAENRAPTETRRADPNRDGSGSSPRSSAV